MSVFTKIIRWLNKPHTDIKIERPLYNEQVDTKVMRVLMGKLRYTTDLDIWLSHNYDSSHWLPILDAHFRSRVRGNKKNNVGGPKTKIGKV